MLACSCSVCAWILFLEMWKNCRSMMPVVAESGTYYYHYNIVAIHSSSFDKKTLLILKLLKKFFHCFSPYNQTNVLLGLFSRKLFLSRNLNGKGLHFNELQTIKSRDWVDYVKLFYCRKATIYCVFQGESWKWKAV